MDMELREIVSRFHDWEECINSETKVREFVGSDNDFEDTLDGNKINGVDATLEEPWHDVPDTCIARIASENDSYVTLYQRSPSYGSMKQGKGKMKKRKMNFQEEIPLWLTPTSILIRVVRNIH